MKLTKYQLGENVYLKMKIIGISITSGMVNYEICPDTFVNDKSTISLNEQEIEKITPKIGEIKW